MEREKERLKTTQNPSILFSFFLTPHFFNRQLKSHHSSFSVHRKTVLLSFLDTIFRSFFNKSQPKPWIVLASKTTCKTMNRFRPQLNFSSIFHSFLARNTTYANNYNQIPKLTKRISFRTLDNTPSETYSENATIPKRSLLRKQTFAQTTTTLLNESIRQNNFLFKNSQLQQHEFRLTE